MNIPMWAFRVGTTRGESRETMYRFAIPITRKFGLNYIARLSRNKRKKVA